MGSPLGGPGIPSEHKSEAAKVVWVPGGGRGGKLLPVNYYQNWWTAISNKFSTYSWTSYLLTSYQLSATGGQQSARSFLPSQPDAPDKQGPADINLRMNRVAVEARETKLPPFFTEFRSGSNGAIPGPQNLNYNSKKNIKNFNFLSCLSDARLAILG